MNHDELLFENSSLRTRLEREQFLRIRMASVLRMFCAAMHSGGSDPDQLEKALIEAEETLEFAEEMQ